MQFEAPITVDEAISRVTSSEYIIPALQRGFVWQPVQVERLLDSLMRDYPIGSFLFWALPRGSVGRYPFYKFQADVVRDGASAPQQADARNGPTVAVLDGQQRLTAFLIATRGSFSWRGRGRSGLRTHRLYLDLLACQTDAGEEDLMYQFKFLTDEEVAAADFAQHQWFRVASISGMTTSDIFKEVQKRGLAEHATAFNTLDLLHRSLTQKPVINYYLEKEDDLGRVLNIFVRLNRAGTTLSYPDLLLSSATLNWKRDARQEFADAVRDINQYGFNFTKDRILKAGMVLADLDNIKFKVNSFSPDQSPKIEEQWKEIRRCLPIAAHLLRSFGLDEATLTAENVIIPVAYYVKSRKLTDSYVQRHADYADRERLKAFVIHSLLKGSFWTGAVDGILLDLRKILRRPHLKAFPLDDVRKAMQKLKKPLTFSTEEIDGLLASRYGRRGTSLVLSLLYPGIELGAGYHQDHIYPKVMLSESRLQRLGMSDSDIGEMLRIRDQLPNLQLLPGPVNLEKSKLHPRKYIASIPSEKRQNYIVMHDLQDLPEDVSDVLGFLLHRRDVMRKRLEGMLR